MSNRYRVEHYFEAIDERGYVEVDTLCQAEQFWQAKTTGHPIHTKQVWMYGPGGELLRQMTMNIFKL